MVWRTQRDRAMDRRQFLRGSAAATAIAVGVPAIVPSSVFGADAPSNRIVMGAIGVGSQGTGNMRGFNGKPGCQVVAVCDVDMKHRQRACKAIGLDEKSGYNDFRQVLARSDIDAVSVATPDHWHVPISIAAVKAGKDVYCEKPLTLAIGGGRKLADAAKRYGRVVQTGSQQRSGNEFRFGCELVRNGYIGDLKTIRVGIPGNNRSCPEWKPEPVPVGFDYNFWLGPAPQAPYTTMRCHYSFRFILDYSGGQMTNWGAHYLDIAQWGNGADDTGPVEIDGKGEFPAKGLFNTADRVDIKYAYANGVLLHLTTGGGHTRFEGTEGWVDITRGRIRTEPESLLKVKIKPNEIHLYNSRDHKQDFLDCIKSRKQPVANAEVGHRSSSLCHLGNISMLLGRPLKWDPKKEKFINDAAADQMITRPMRSPWRL